MAITTSTRRHAFLSPGHNAWSCWTWQGTTTITNPGASHRTLEVLAFAIDTMVADGWSVRQIFVDQGTPTLVLLERDEPVEASGQG